jgi:hypothetical protein
MNIIKVTKERLTKGEAAELLGLKAYDAAIPQQWEDNLFNEMSMSPAGRTGQLHPGWKGFILSSLVWCYDNGSFIGYPVVLTKKTMDLLNMECVRAIWDFSKQDAVLEIPEPQKEEDFILEGYEPIRYAVKAVNQEEAEKKFRAKYPKARITSLKIKLGSHISYTKNQPKE